MCNLWHNLQLAEGGQYTKLYLLLNNFWIQSSKCLNFVIKHPDKFELPWQLITYKIILKINCWYFLVFSGHVRVICFCLKRIKGKQTYIFCKKYHFMLGFHTPHNICIFQKTFIKLLSCVDVIDVSTEDF